MPLLPGVSLHPQPHAEQLQKDALDQFEWRHNNIVNYLHSLFSSQRLEGVEVYADLEGHRVNGVTIPSDVAMTAQKPDLVIINRKSKEVKLVELTVPWDTNTNMTAALTRKTERYMELTTTIQGNGFKCLNIPLEIGTRGVVNTRNKNVLTQLCHGLKVNKVSSVIKNCSKLALLRSYTLWNTRYLTARTGGGFLKP